MNTDTAPFSKKKNDSRPTRIEIELIDGRARACLLDQGYFLGGRIMHVEGSHMRLALVGIHMPLLGGDQVDVQVKVGTGVVLEVIEPSGMVAYNSEGKRSEWKLDAKIEAGAILIWHGKEFVVAKGSNAYRQTNIKLEKNARALFKETLVLGRSNESDVRLNNRTQVFLDDEELLTEELALTPETRGLPGIIDKSKVIGTVMAMGMTPSNDVAGAQRLDLAGPGALWRSLAPAAHFAEKEAEPVFRHWQSEILRSFDPNEIDVANNNRLQFDLSN